MSNNASASFYQSTNDNSSTSTLRPRNTRLISYLEDDSTNADPLAVTTSNSSTPLRFNSRNASPTTSNNTTRTKTKPHLQSAFTETRAGNDRGHQRSVSTGVNKSTGGPLWDSWSSLQGIASTLLGSDVSNPSVRRASSVRKAGQVQQERTAIFKPSVLEWGPSADSKVQSSSAEDHKALLQAKKREALLAGSAEALKDSLGRFKRKDSNADIRPYNGDQDSGDDVLVYRHTVLPQDTMAGVMIKYNCQPDAFRKANRFWPNDNIQRRKFVVLPVTACAVKGRKVDGPDAVDLLDAEVRREGKPKAIFQEDNSPAILANSNNEESTATEPFPPAEVKEEDENYKHEYWVVLPTFPHAIEILRVSKRVLGYFPPTRRKSNSNSPLLLDSGASTPKTSFDMLRHPPTHAAQRAQLHQQLQSLSPSRSPMRQSSVPRHLSSPARNRASSTVSISSGTSSPFFSALQGPGGVGTLRGLRTERAIPGPGDDPLNKKLAPYIPDFLPPEVDRSSSLLRPVYTSRTSSVRGTPRVSTDSIRSSRSNSSGVPSGIEGWMRKVAGSGAAAVTTSPMRKKGDAILRRSDSADLFGQAAAAGDDFGAGDLIELDITPDAISRQLHDREDDDATPTATAMPTPIIEQTGSISSKDEEELNERFPIRGRVRRAYQAD